ncbi:hypothetical protein GCM10010266_72310 [Streptomyces griseomycini]|nr:hypothetical protein GCM10010266_72310 [Streptomyces griseomycini]GGR61408.1 hypothetical protein GCM10015536_76740 [Streptomyces griseomycini]
MVSDPVDKTNRPPTHLRGHRRGRDALICDLFAHPLKNPFGDSRFVSLSPHLHQLLGQLLFECALRTPGTLRSRERASLPCLVSPVVGPTAGITRQAGVPVVGS